jgi:uncharacterized protein (TIGR02996 family)
LTTATDPTLAGLLRAVCLDPADDGPRLVLADWYDEHGQPERSEFIRLQVELARMDEAGEGQWPDDGHTCWAEPCPVCTAIGRYKALESREGWLRGTVGRRVMSALPPKGLWTLHPNDSDYPDLPKVEFCRGFVEAVTLSTQAFLDNAAALFGAQPVTRVTLADKRPWQPGPDGSPGPSRWWPGTDWDDRGRAAAESLPGDVFDVLAGGKREGGGVVYPTRADAVMAASAACVRFGRRKAGLPALETAGRMP